MFVEICFSWNLQDLGCIAEVYFFRFITWWLDVVVKGWDGNAG